MFLLPWSTNKQKKRTPLSCVLVDFDVEYMHFEISICFFGHDISPFLFGFVVVRIVFLRLGCDSRNLRTRSVGKIVARSDGDLIADSWY